MSYFVMFLIGCSSVIFVVAAILLGVTLATKLPKH